MRSVKRQLDQARWRLFFLGFLEFFGAATPAFEEPLFGEALDRGWQIHGETLSHGQEGEAPALAMVPAANDRFIYGGTP